MRQNTLGVTRGDFDSVQAYKSTVNKASRKRNYALASRVKLAKGCHDCPDGTFWLPCALEFHHLDPSTKKAAVAKLATRAVSTKTMMEEMAKCEVLCANHHREKHHNEKM